MSVKKMTSDDVVMFEPSDRSMLIDYPELANYPEFNNPKMSPRDIKFVYYLSNRTSPIIKEPKIKRIKKACELAYNTRAIENNPRIKAIYEKQELPKEIVDAIHVMASFNPDFRMRAKLLNEYSFDMLQSLVFIDEPIVDLEDRKKYADLLIKTTAALQTMVTNMESGFGVKVKKEKEKEFAILAKVDDIIDRVESTK